MVKQQIDGGQCDGQDRGLSFQIDMIKMEKLMRGKGWLGVLGLCLGMQGYAYAQDGNSEPPADLTQIPIEELVKMEVLSAARLAQQISDAPSAVAIVTAQDIKDYGYRTLADILNSMRGLYTTYDHAFDYLGGRGFSRPGDYAGRVLLLIDGYASNDNIYNQMYLDHSGLLDVELIERVEYVPGTGSVLYGNNAYFGIISVTTKKGRSFGGLQAAADVFSEGGRKGRLTYGNKLENGADVLVSASWLDRDGEDLRFPEFNATNGGVAKGMDYEKSKRFFGKLHYENWELEAGYVYRHKSVPTTLDGVPFNQQNLFRDTNGFLSARYDTNFGAALKSSTHVYSGMYLDRGVYDLAAGTEYAMNRGVWWGVDQKFFYSGLEGHRMVFGAEYRDDARFDFSNIFAKFDQDRQTVSLYGQDEIALGQKWLLNVGARYDKANDADSSISPRLALIYMPTAQTTLKAAYSSAFRLPAAIEKYNFDGNTPGSEIANPALDSEKVTTQELVLRHEISRNFIFTGSLYHFHTQDLIASVDLPTGFSQFVNTGSSRTRGLEIEIERLWANGVRLRTSYAHQLAEDVDGHTAINAPRHLGKFNLSFPLFDYRARGGLELQYTGPRLTEMRDELGGYTMANLTLTTDRLIPSASVSMTLKNLFDKEYSVVAPGGILPDTLKMDGRTFWLNMNYDFK